MQLNYCPRALSKQLRVLVLMSVLFVFGTVYAIWIDTDGGPKRAMVMFLMPVCAVFTTWAAVKTLRFNRTGLFAAEIGSDGVRINTFISQRVFPWGALKDIREGEIRVRKVTVPAVEIEPARGLPVRLTVAALSNSALEIEQWIEAAQTRLAAAK